MGFLDWHRGILYFDPLERRDKAVGMDFGGEAPRGAGCLVNWVDVANQLWDDSEGYGMSLYWW